MIFWSSPESIRDRVLSITATTESVVAAGLICFLGLYFDNFLILLPGVFVAWLVLLRSKESVELGAKWFTRWEHRGGKPGDRQTPATRQSAPSQLLSGKFLLRGAVGFAVAFMLAHLSLKQLQGWELFLGSLCLAAKAHDRRVEAHHDQLACSVFARCFHTGESQT
jgi:hypothetical protein